MKKRFVMSIVQVASVLAVCMLLILISGVNPIAALGVFVQGIFGNCNGVAEVFIKAVPLMLAGLGIAVAFQTGFFNLGAEGQLYMGALTATVIVLALDFLPGLMRILAAVLTAFVVGGIWAFIPAFLKNKLEISEAITTIMFNYIALMIVGVAIRGPLQDPSDFLAQSPMIDNGARLSLLLPPTRLHSGFIIAVLAGACVWFLMKKTTVGYELRMVGLNRRTAYCNGLPVVKSFIFSALLSGGLAGLAGMNEVLGVQFRLLEGISSNNGYTAVLIALLARNNPLGVIGASLALAAVQVGANAMQRKMGVPSSIVSIFIGLIVLMVLCKEFVPIVKEYRKQRETVR